MKNKLIYLTILAFLFTMGCATLPGSQENNFLQATSETKGNQEDALKKRAEGLLQAKVDRKWDVVYTYLTSDFREAKSQDDFARRSRNLRFKSFNIKNIEILPSGNEAIVNVAYEISMKGFDFKDAPEKQNWVKEKGQWFMKLKPKPDSTLGFEKKAVK